MHTPHVQMPSATTKHHNVLLTVSHLCISCIGLFVIDSFFIIDTYAGIYVQEQSLKTFPCRTLVPNYTHEALN